MKRFGKRSAIFLLFFTLITGMLAGPWQPAAQAASSYHARVTVSTAKVHTSPSGRAHTVAKLHRNATVKVIGTRGSWKKISYGGKTRYIYAKYIKKSTPSYSFRSYTNYVKSYSLVMRSKASSHYRKIRSLYMNYKVTVIGAKGSYRYVQYGSRKGYVQAKWLKSKVTSYGAYVVPGSINLWKGPGKKYGRVGYLHQNNKITWTGSSHGYLKVNYNGTKGYAWGGYFKNGTPPKAAAAPAPVKAAAPAPVKTSAPAPAPAPAQASYAKFQTHVGIDGLDLYPKPDENSNAITTMPERDLVTVIGEQGDWYQVQWGKYTGFVEKKYLTNDMTLFQPTGQVANGIDISHYQNEAILESTQNKNSHIDFKAIKDNHNSFVIIKATDTNFSSSDKTDKYFIQNVLDAASAGLKIYTYHYLRSGTNTDEAKNEADIYSSALDKASDALVKAGYDSSLIGYNFVDVEKENGNGDLTDSVNTFLQEMRSKNYNKLGVYSYHDYFDSHVNWPGINQPSKVLLWLARYRGLNTSSVNTPKTPGAAKDTYNVDMWQYTSKGSVNGIDGYVDQDVSYFDPNNM